MTKSILTIILLISSVLVSCNDSKKMVDFEWSVYSAAVENGDASTAINSLNRIVAMEKYNADALDTLAILYLSNRVSTAAAKIAVRALAVRESDRLLMVAAKANKNIGKHEVALGYFKTLLTKTPDNLELIYDVAFSHLNLKQLSDALPHVKNMIKHPESGTTAMEEFINEGSQMIPFKAVGLNMLGYIQMQAGQPAEAIKSYQAALQVFPKYYLANNNLKVLQEQLK